MKTNKEIVGGGGLICVAITPLRRLMRGGVAPSPCTRSVLGGWYSMSACWTAVWLSWVFFFFFFSPLASCLKWFSSRVACRRRSSPSEPAHSYFMPLRSTWLAAMSMTLMMKAMAKAQIRLLRTHVCFTCCVGLEPAAAGREERASELQPSNQPRPRHYQDGNALRLLGFETKTGVRLYISKKNGQWAFKSVCF